MNMRLLITILFWFALSSVAEAIDASVQYKPGKGNYDYRKYSPASPVSEQSLSVSQHGDEFRQLIETTAKAKDEVYKNAWSGTRKELESVVTKAEREYGFEDSKHLGRNATMLVPATLNEMRREMANKSTGWDSNLGVGWHTASAKKGDGWWKATKNSVDNYINGGVEKYVNDNGAEAVYDTVTGKIVLDEHMGTKNFATGFINFITGVHGELDVDTHHANDKYKYAGILFERDPNDPNKYYIIDGQTGLPMTPQQVAEMPTTLSDMWKDMGLSCVSNDSEDIVPPKKDSQQILTTDMSRQKDSNDKLAIGSVVDGQASTNDTSQVGVRGWCDCGDKHGKRYDVGDTFCICDKLKCDLAYTLCGRCGCAVRPKDCAGDGLQIVDLNLERELKRRSGGKLSWSDAFKPLKERQAEIEAMPNGRIIAGGACVCKEADPIKVGFTNKITGEFFVCCLCGRVREPDKNGDIPTGPTALSEMGLNDQARKAEERIDKWLNGRSE